MYQIPTLEQIKLNFFNKSIFPLLDLKYCFYHCELDANSEKYCCFSTPLGCNNFLRLTFGLASASEKFQNLQLNILVVLKMLMYILMTSLCQVP